MSAVLCLLKQILISLAGRPQRISLNSLRAGLLEVNFLLHAYTSMERWPNRRQTEMSRPEQWSVFLHTNGAQHTTCLVLVSWKSFFRCLLTTWVPFIIRRTRYKFTYPA